MNIPFEIFDEGAKPLSQEADSTLISQSCSFQSCKKIRYKCKENFIDVFIKECSGFIICFKQYQLKEHDAFYETIDENYIRLSIVLTDPLLDETSTGKHTVVKASSFNIVYLSHQKERIVFATGQSRTLLDIYFNHSLLQIIKEAFPDTLYNFADQVEHHVSTMLFDTPMYATIFMCQLSQNILSLLSTKNPNWLLLSLNVQSLIAYGVFCKQEQDLRKRTVGLNKITRIHGIANRLLNDFSNIPNIPSLAKYAEMNTTDFKMLFKEEMQESPYTFWSNRRLYSALEKIVNTSESIKEVALDLGFSSLSNFSKAFKKKFGKSPSYYRK